MAFTPETFAAAVLRGLGIQPTEGAVKALVGWQRAEGGHWHNDAKFNPLNTTQPEPGAGNTGTQGNIKVYRSPDQGIQATVQTLKNGRYGGIISALQKGDPGAVAQAIGQSPWGTNASLVARAIGGTGSVSVPTGGSAPAGGSAYAPPSSRTTTSTVGAVDNSQGRKQLALSFLLGGAGPNGQQNTSDPLTLALAAQGLKDQPGQKVTTTVPGSAVGASSNLTNLTSRANAIDSQHLPYAWGGGHQGQTPISKAVPLDCSGAVSKVLGIDPRVASQFKSFGQPGDGGNRGVTIYAKDTHVLMKIDGHFFGTSATNPGGGAGWIKQQDISPQYLQGFTVRHI